MRRDRGTEVANQIARGLVAAPHWDGGQAQYVPAPVAVAGEASLSGTRGWALDRLGEPLMLRVLAQHAGLSQRTFMRRFTEETGTTPLQGLLNARLSWAREVLETTDHPVDRVARDCGLGTAANLRLHFRRALRTTPTAYRRTLGRSTSPSSACSQAGLRSD
ncbi:helix-turn-helix domain-containing protein [Streptomyces sp. NPDC003442]